MKKGTTAAIGLTLLAIVVTGLAGIQLGLDIPFDVIAGALWVAALAAWGISV